MSMIKKIFRNIVESYDGNFHPYQPELPPNHVPQTGDFLYCHTNLVMDDTESIEATFGKFYEVIDSNHHDISIIDNSGDNHSFEKRGEDSYTKWFKLISKEDREIFNKDFFEDLN